MTNYPKTLLDRLEHCPIKFAHEAINKNIYSSTLPNYSTKNHSKPHDNENDTENQLLKEENDTSPVMQVLLNHLLWPCNSHDECIEQCALRITLRCNENNEARLVWPRNVAYSPQLHVPLQPFRNKIFLNVLTTSNWPLRYCQRIYNWPDCETIRFRPAKGQRQSLNDDDIDRRLIKLKLTVDVEMSEQKMIYKWRELVLYLSGLCSLWFGFSVVSLRGITHLIACKPPRLHRFFTENTCFRTLECRLCQWFQALTQTPLYRNRRQTFQLLLFIGFLADIIDINQLWTEQNHVLVTYLRRAKQIRMPTISICTPIRERDTGRFFVDDLMDMGSLSSINNYTGWELIRQTQAYYKRKFLQYEPPPVQNSKYYNGYFSSMVDIRVEHLINKVEFLDGKMNWIVLDGAREVAHLRNQTMQQSLYTSIFLYRDNLCVKFRSLLGRWEQERELMQTQQFLRLTYYRHRLPRFYVHTSKLIHLSNSFLPPPDQAPSVRFETYYTIRSHQRSLLLLSDQEHLNCTGLYPLKEMVKNLQNGFRCDDQSNWLAQMFCTAAASQQTENPNAVSELERDCGLSHVTTHLPLPELLFSRVIQNKRYFKCLLRLDKLLQKPIEMNSCDLSYVYSIVYRSNRQQTHFLGNDSNLSQVELNPSLIDFIQVVEQRISRVEALIYTLSALSFWLDLCLLNMTIQLFTFAQHCLGELTSYLTPRIKRLSNKITNWFVNLLLY